MVITLTPGVHQLSPEILPMTLFPLWLSLLDTGASPPLPFFLVYLSFSYPFHRPSWDSIENFFQVDKAHVKFYFRYSSCILLKISNAFIVPHRGMKPNCMLSKFTNARILLSSTLSTSFIPYFKSFTPLYQCFLSLTPGGALGCQHDFLFYVWSF